MKKSKITNLKLINWPKATQKPEAVFLRNSFEVQWTFFSAEVWINLWVIKQRISNVNDTSSTPWDVDKASISVWHHKLIWKFIMPEMDRLTVRHLRQLTDYSFLVSVPHDCSPWPHPLTGKLFLPFSHGLVCCIFSGDSLRVVKLYFDVK